MPNSQLNPQRVDSHLRASHTNTFTMPNAQLYPNEANHSHLRASHTNTFTMPNSQLYPQRDEVHLPAGNMVTSAHPSCDPCISPGRKAKTRLTAPPPQRAKRRHNNQWISLHEACSVQVKVQNLAGEKVNVSDFIIIWIE